jgi:hypothetical protein
MPETARAKKPSIEKLSLEEQIRRRAYELYVLRGNQSGSELDDRLQAEGEIRSAQEEPSTKRRKSLFQPRPPRLGKLWPDGSDRRPSVGRVLSRRMLFSRKMEQRPSRI